MLRLNRSINIRKDTYITDSEGFSEKQSVSVASVKAYREGRHGSSMWSNLAAFSTATDLFIIRTIPGVTVSTDMYIVDGDIKFDIESVEEIKGKKLYIQILARKVEPTGGESTVQDAR